MAALILFAATHVNADETEQPGKEAVAMDSITVTANKMEETPQQIPMSISAMDEIDISDKAVKQTSRIFQCMPNMHMTKMGPLGARNIASVRGITSFMTGGAVFGFFVDDVFYPSADINLVDVERIEVLRGPQGTLYGKNTEAGVINIITKAPENLWAGDVSLSYGNYNTLETMFAGGGALVKDKLFLRMAGKFWDSDGYFTNTVDDDDQVNEGRTYDGRISLFYKPTDKLTADLKINLQNYDSNYAEFAPFDKVMDGDFDVAVNDPGQTTKDFTNGSLKVAYDMKNLRLTSITTALNEDSACENDVDFTENDSSFLKTKAEINSYTQEFRLNSLTSSQLKWTTGVYLYTGSDDQRQIYDAKSMGGMTLSGNSDDSGVAVFGQADYTINRLVVTAGLRYEYEKKDFDYEWDSHGLYSYYYPAASGTVDKDFDAILPKLALMYHLTEDFRPYACVSRGFKSGGFNLSTDPGQAYDSEYTWNYELGFKSELFENKVQLNAAVFYINWEDLQVEQPSYPDYVIENAAEATSKGVEIELTVRPVTGLKLYGSLGYVDASFDEYTNDGVDYSGKDIPNSPSRTYSLGGTWRFYEHFMVNAELNGTGTIYYEADNVKSQDSYEIVNLKAGYESNSFDVYIWAENLFDQAYATRAFSMNNMSGGQDWWARAGDPLTFGVTVKYRF